MLAPSSSNEGADGGPTNPADATSSNPISCPLVLQCGGCRTIVGDTCSLNDLNSDLRTITIEKKGVGAVVDSVLLTSTQEVDYGSTYNLIKCRQCDAALGRHYRSTGPELDHWRGHYTFSSELLAFYELTGFSNSNNNFPSPSLVDGDTSKGASAASSIEIVKLQKFCMYLYERVCDLEEKLNTSLHNKVKKGSVGYSDSSSSLILEQAPSAIDEFNNHKSAPSNDKSERLFSATRKSSNREDPLSPPKTKTPARKTAEHPFDSESASETPSKKDEFGYFNEEEDNSAGERSKKKRGRPKKIETEQTSREEEQITPTKQSKKQKDKKISTTPLKQVFTTSQDADFQI